MDLAIVEGLGAFHIFFIISLSSLDCTTKILQLSFEPKFSAPELNVRQSLKM